MTRLVSTEATPLECFARFELTTSRGHRYMRVSRTNYRNDERWVVVVESQKFVALWDDEEARCGPTSWRMDRKFSDAERGFSHGAPNPVPLAVVARLDQKASHTPLYERRWNLFKRLAGYSTTKQDVLYLTNGITRTMWLLVHEAESFPIECGADDARRLHELAGLPGTTPITVDNLVPAYCWAEIPDEAVRP